MYEGLILTSEKFKHYIQKFNEKDEELYAHIPNSKAWDFLQRNIPLFEIDEPLIEITWYFRWWTYRKHVKKTPDGYVITEFLPPVPWAGKYNTISCPAAHHIYEGRWLLDQKYMDDYENFWLKKGGEPRKYSFWIADAFYNRYLVNKNEQILIDLLPGLIDNYKAWEKGKRYRKFKTLKAGLHINGLFFQIDDRDGGEMSIGGHGYRPTINSYMYGDARAISKIAELAGKDEIKRIYEEKATEIKRLVQKKLWDSQNGFFKTLKKRPSKLVDVKELIGYYPWYFNMPDNQFNIAWDELMDPEGFFAPYGPTTAEQRHPRFQISYEGHQCQWNGPSWPHATSILLTAMANLLNNYTPENISTADYMKMLLIYTKCHTLTRENGDVVPWIGENINPYTGDWIARTRLKNWEKGIWPAHKGGKERGKDYNHSTYNDLIITGLIGLRPRPDNILEINPLIPHTQSETPFDYFCLDRLLYHGHLLTICWDKMGDQYHKGKGFQLFCDGNMIASCPYLVKLTASLES